MAHARMPRKQGLYDPRFEHDACGIGFVCQIDGRRSHQIIQRGLQVLVNLTHRARPAPTRPRAMVRAS